MQNNHTVEHILEHNVIPLSTLRFAVLSGVFALVAVLLPYLTHTISPTAGPVFLPMHLVVLAGGLLFGWRFGLVLGLVSPLLNHLISGLPPAIILNQMTFEVGAYGLAAGLFREYSKLPVLAVTLLALLAGRVVLFIVLSFMTLPLAPAQIIWNSIITGWPGLLIQIIALPLLLILVRRWFTRAPQDHENA